MQEWNDVVVELRPEDRRQLVEQCRKRLNIQEKEEIVTISGRRSSDYSGSANGVARAILGALSPDAAVPLDQLIEVMEGHSSSEIIAALFELELSGLVRQLPGKSFLKVWAD